MAGTVATSYHDIDGAQVIQFAWTGDAAGAADGTSTQKFAGRVIAYRETPSPTTAPTNLYDVRVLDEDGADVLNGQGANVAVPGTRHKTLEDKLGAVVNSTLTLEIRNSGNRKLGTTRLVIR
jgi:hypothetical protein